MSLDEHCEVCGAPRSSKLNGNCPACLMGLGTPLPAGNGSTVSDRDVAPQISEAPRYLGDYELLEEIARGGMGAVYRARQLSLKRVVAVKILLTAEFANETSRKRFRREAEAAASLAHPNIVSIYEVSEHEGQPFFAMELIEGQSLAEVTREKPVLAQQAARWLKTIAEAVHFAHQHGILHRDLKPSNVLVDRMNVPHITDFGLAKQNEVDASLTLSGQVLGTPSFMPPEQADPKRGATTAGSDVYSLGAVLYHLLTTRPPFIAETLTQTLRLVTEAEPVSPRLLNTTVPLDLETICLKCLEKDPKRRYASAQELAEELGRFLNNEPIEARPPSRVYRFQKLVRRNRLAFGAGTAVMVTLVLGTVTSTWQAVRATRFRDEARGQASLAENEAITNRQNLYAADMNLAAQALERSNLPRARELLEKHRPASGNTSNSALRADLRGWEWRYLMGQCRSDEIALLGRFPSRVFTVAISSNGQWLAAACSDGTIPVWDLRTQRQVTTFEVFRGAASFVWDDRTIAATFSPDSRMLAAGGTNRDIFLWNVETHAKLATLTGHGNKINHLAFSPDGSLLASASDDGTACLWDLRSQPPRELAKIEPGIGGVLCVTFSPDSKVLVTGGIRKLVKIWNISEPAQPRLIGTLDALWTECAAFSPDGKRLAICASETSMIRVWEFPSLRELAPLRGQSGQHMWLAYSPDGRRLASAGGNLCIGLWDLDSSQVTRMLKGHEANTSSLAFAPDGQTLVSGGFDGTVRLWDVSDKSRVEPGFRVQSFIHTLAISRDSKYAALLENSGSGLDRLILWDIQAKREVAAQDFANSYEGQIEFAPDGKRVCVTSASVARWFEIPSLKLLGEEPADRLVFAENGSFATFSRTGQIVRRDFPSGLETVLDSHIIGSHCSALSPDGELFVIAGGTAEIAEIAMWNTRRPGPPILLIGHKSGGLYGVAWSPDGKLLASACWDGQVGLWDRSGRLIQFLHGHSGAVWNVAFSRDGRTLASSGDDGTIKLWNLASLQEAATLRGHEGPVSGLAFSPDGRYLVSGGGGTVRLWSAPTFEEVARGGRTGEQRQ